MFQKLTVRLMLTALSLFAPAVAFAQDATTCDYSACLTCMVGENPIKSGLAIIFAVVTMIFGFKKKALPAWIKDAVTSFLGRKPSKP